MSMSTTKQTALYAQLADNPEIDTANITFIKRLVTRAGDWIVSTCHLPRYPELAQGYSKSMVTPTEDLTGLATNVVEVSVNESAAQEITIDLANCDTGAHTAAELQSCIQAIDENYYDEVTVTFADSYYTITSGRYGEWSAINVTFGEDYKDVAQYMQLSPDYGGTEVYGSADDDEIDALCVMLVETLYSKIGVEGIQSGTVPDGLAFSEAALDPRVRMLLQSKRRGWS